VQKPTTKMSNINSRRGTSSSLRHNHHHYHVNLDRIIQCFILTTAVIIIGGYYYFISSASSSVLLLHDNNNSGGSDIHNIRGGSDNKSYNNKRNNNNNNNAVKAIAKATIGYAITVSGCPKNNGSRGDFGAGIIDGAAVLKHSIHLNSIRADNSDTATTTTTTTTTTASSKYDYQMYALVHPTAEHCARSQLQPLGYSILIRDTPIPLKEIQGNYLRERVPNNGCCGDKEFVKLHAYTLVEHPIVVHLDLDTLVMRPMDDIFDLMIDGTHNEKKKIDVAFNDPIDTTSTQQQRINAFFTRDYNMANHGMKHVGVQGGFLVLRPDLKVYEEFQEIIRTGDFRKNGGWGGMGFGPFYGVSTCWCC